MLQVLQRKQVIKSTTMRQFPVLPHHKKRNFLHTTECCLRSSALTVKREPTTFTHPSPKLPQSQGFKMPSGQNLYNLNGLVNETSKAELQIKCPLVDTLKYTAGVINR